LDEEIGHYREPPRGRTERKSVGEWPAYDEEAERFAGAISS
jgi:hypothetical protein